MDRTKFLHPISYRWLRRQPVDLTSREWEVLELIRQGLSTGDIAGRLFITNATVRTHIAAILRKLHATDRKQVLALLSSDD